jgi:hypothetical protein
MRNRVLKPVRIRNTAVCILIGTILIVGESLDKLIFMKKMNEAWSSHCQQIIMCRFVSRILVNLREKIYK